MLYSNCLAGQQIPFLCLYIVAFPVFSPNFLHFGWLRSACLTCSSHSPARGAPLRWCALAKTHCFPGQRWMLWSQPGWNVMGIWGIPLSMAGSEMDMSIKNGWFFKYPHDLGNLQIAIYTHFAGEKNDEQHINWFDPLIEVPLERCPAMRIRGLSPLSQGFAIRRGLLPPTTWREPQVVASPAWSAEFNVCSQVSTRKSVHHQI